MKWCIDFPQETILVVRPCLKAICMDIKPAAKLLSVLLYRYSIRKEAKEDAENINEAKVSQGKTADQDTTFTIYRKQAQLINDMCDEITDKTLHDVAIPCLYLLGFLDVDDSTPIHRYTVYVDRVQQAIKLASNQQALEKFLMTITRISLEEFLMNKKNFQLALEEFLITNRKSSNGKRGRKARPEAALEGVAAQAQIHGDYKRLNKKDSLHAPDGAKSGDFSFSKKTVPSKTRGIDSTSGKQALTPEEVTALDEWDKQNGIPCDRTDYTTRAMATYVAALVAQGHMRLGDMARLIAMMEALDYIKKQGLTPALFKQQLPAQLKLLKKQPTQASTQEQPRTHDSYGNAASAGKSPLDFILNNSQKSEPVLTH